jgi:hypothetical protein
MFKWLFGKKKPVAKKEESKRKPTNVSQRTNDSGYTDSSVWPLWIDTSSHDSGGGWDGGGCDSGGDCGGGCD